MQSPYLIAYICHGEVEFGQFFHSLAAARCWAKWFVRDFDSIVVYSADGQVVETVKRS